MTAIATPDQRRALRELLAARTPPDMKFQFNTAVMRNADPVDDYAQKIVYDRTNPHADLMRQASMAAGHLRAYARGHDIDLHARKWVDPDSLGGHAEKLTGIFNQISLSDNYRAWEDDCSFAFARHLVSQNQFSDMLHHWRDYTDRQRIQSAAWFSVEQQKIFARNLMTPAITCVHGFSQARTEPPHPRIKLGLHRSPGHGRRSHEMGFNTHPDAGFDELPRALIVKFHENLHATQYTLAAHAASGDIGPGHPLYDEARLFAMAFAFRESYISVVDPVYRAHPLEADTHPQSDRFLKILSVTLQENGLPPLSGP